MNIFGTNSNKDRTATDYLWCPYAEIGLTKMKTQGKYRKGFPEGAIIHYTAGRDETEKDAINTLKWGTNQNYCFFVIGPTGVIYQSFPLSHWGYHAGKSSYDGLGDGVSRYLVGIEVVCAGKLKQVKKEYAAWFNLMDGSNPSKGVKSGQKLYQDDQVNYVLQDNRTFRAAGYYKKFTVEQEESLTQLILWLKKTHPDVFNLDYVLGHQEVSPFRKEDPGGSLSMPLDKYREHLKGLVNANNSN